MANKVMCNAVELKGAIYALFVSENILVLHVFLLWGQSEFLSIEICMLLPPLTQGTDKATRICLILKPSRTMSPLHFNLLFILVFSTTCIAVQERAIGMSNYNFQRHGSFIVPKYFTQSHAACFMSNILKSSRWRLSLISWRISSWLPRKVGLAVRVLLYVLA